MIRASIGKGVIDIDAPVKGAASQRVTAAPNRAVLPDIAKASAPPRTKGSTIPAAETDIALRRRWRRDRHRTPYLQRTYIRPSRSGWWRTGRLWWPMAPASRQIRAPAIRVRRAPAERRQSSRRPPAVGLFCVPQRLPSAPPRGLSLVEERIE